MDAGSPHAVSGVPAFEQPSGSDSRARREMTVLFVDDDESLLAGLGRVIQQQKPGWACRFASSVVDAVAVLAHRAIDAVITDMSMPRETGFDLIKRMRSCEAWSSIPV